MPCSVTMTALFVALLASLRATVGLRLELAAEVFALRHQLAVLQRATPRRPPSSDRLAGLDVASSLSPNWRRGDRGIQPGERFVRKFAFTTEISASMPKLPDRDHFVRWLL